MHKANCYNTILCTKSCRSSPLVGVPKRSLRLVAQDAALSRRKQGFESPRERQSQRRARLAGFVEKEQGGGEKDQDRQGAEQTQVEVVNQR
jgi:hypothetical protein